MSSSGQLSSRNARQLLLSRSFGLLFAAKLLSTTAIWAHGAAAAILVYDRTGSSVAVAVVTTAQYAPQLLLAPASGIWADRYDPTRQLVIGRAACVSGAALTLAWVGYRSDHASGLESTIAVSVGAGLVGIGMVVGGPAAQAIIPALVRRDELTVAIALNTAPMTLARIIGPTLGALAVATAGPFLGFSISVAGQAAFIPLVVLARLPGARGPGRGKSGAQVREVLSFLRRNARVAAGLIGMFAVGMGSEPVLSLAPALAESLGQGETAVGLLSTSFGVGAGLVLVLTSTLGARFVPGRLARVGLAVLCGGLLGCSVAPWLWTCLLCTVVMGAGFSAALTGLSTTVQAGTPDPLRGRVMSFWLLAFLGSRPFSVGLAGLISDLSGVRWAFAFAGTAVALLSLLGAWCLSGRHRGLSQQDARHRNRTETHG